MTEQEHSNLWFDLAKRSRPSKVVDFPALDEQGKPLCQVCIRTLTHDDHISIAKLSTIECDRTFSEEKNIDRNGQLYRERLENISAKHFLFRCCRDPLEDKPFFPTPDHVGRHLSNDEIAMLLKHYQTLQDERGPLIAYMTSDQMSDTIEKLVKDAENSPYFLDRILPEAQNQLILFMANQLWNYQTGKFSPGLPPESSTTSTKTEPQPSPSQVPVVPVQKSPSKK